MATTPLASPAMVIDNPAAPELFADGVVGVFLNNGNAHITFTSRRCDHSQNPGTLSDAVVGRLVIPFIGLENMVEFLDSFVARMKEQFNAASAGTTRPS